MIFGLLEQYGFSYNMIAVLVKTAVITSLLSGLYQLIMLVYEWLERRYLFVVHIESFDPMYKWVLKFLVDNHYLD